MRYRRGRHILTLALSCFFLTACATNFTPSQVDDQGNQTNYLIEGSEPKIADAVYAGIISRFTSDKVDAVGKDQDVFVWDHRPFLDNTNYRLTIRKGTGVDQTGARVSGYFYTIVTQGTQAFVEGHYLRPLDRAIRKSVTAAGLKIVNVDRLTPSDAPSDAPAPTDPDASGQ
jgi:hypothetical protein